MGYSWCINCSKPMKVMKAIAGKRRRRMTSVIYLKLYIFIFYKVFLN
jgi:hypothetical protein